MRTFWITFFSGLLFIAGFNYWVDPAHRWHRTNLSFMKNWSPDSCWLTPKEMDTFQFKLRHIDLIQRPDLLFLGSSRVMGASTEMLGPGVTSYNGGIHSAGAEEYVVVWEKMLRAKGAPRFLIIFVDPWVFNQSRLNTQWLPGLSLYFSFLRRVEDSKSGLSSLWLLRHSVPELSKHYWAEFAELFSWETFKTSVALLYDGKISEGTSLVSRNYEIPPDKSCYSSDGSRRIHEPSETEETLRKAATKQYATGDVPAIAHWKFNPAALDLFTKLLSDAQRAGTKTLVIVPPYHPLVVSLLNKREGYTAVFPEYLGALSGIKNAAVCNALDPAMAGCEELEFTDPLHPGPSCIKKVIQHCVAAAGWQINPSSLSLEP